MLHEHDELGVGEQLDASSNVMDLTHFVSEGTSRADSAAVAFYMLLTRIPAGMSPHTLYKKRIYALSCIFSNRRNLLPVRHTPSIVVVDNSTA
jgi:hypothetical protein